MVRRCFGRGLAATAIGYLALLFVDQFIPLGSRQAPFLAALFIGATAWWGASRAVTLRQGGVHGALTMLMPAAFWTFLFNAFQYEWGGPQAFNVDHIWYSLILLGLPLGLGALVGAVVGHLHAKKLPS